MATLPTPSGDEATAATLAPSEPGSPGPTIATPAPPPDTILGRTVLGNYVVERKLGSGGMGSVYLLRHKELPDTRAALKVLRNVGGVEGMKERFRQEALAAAAVGSHRVVRPIDIGQFDDQ